ncbi:MAG: RimK/LysX family protein [Vicingaceae bacterium]
MKNTKTTLGRAESVAFPELGIESIEAKIDTGAYSTAIHASEIWLEEVGDTEVLNFKLLDASHPEFKDEVFKSSNFKRKKVRSSNGRLEKRFILKTKIILGGKKRVTYISLTDRSKMRYPVLIGRKVLKNGFLVDVSKKNLHKK